MPLSSDDMAFLLEDYDTNNTSSATQRGKGASFSPSTPDLLPVLAFVLSLSLVLNLLSYLSIQRIHNTESDSGGQTKYGMQVVSTSMAVKLTNEARLSQDYPEVMNYATAYGVGATSDDEKQALWDAIDISEGIIAVPQTWAKEHGVPPSQTFPWDYSRDIYVLGAYHNMHCLKSVQAYTTDASNRLESRIPYQHVVHCIDVLRQNILCEADDNLLAQKPHSQGGLDRRPGDGQARMCKDWNQLSTFAKQFNACYKRLNITRGGIDAGVSSEIERYRFCPEGSPYLPAMKQFFGEEDV